MAGKFYPSDPAQLREEVQSYLRAAPAVHARRLKALAVPHAGYIYSGPVAGAAYGLLPPLKDRIKKVILLGPSHRIPLYGLCLPEVRAFGTPLGFVEVDEDAREKLRGLGGIEVSDRVHALEHSLEVQLPFLQVALGHDFMLTPLCVGHGDPQDVAAVLERLWGGDETLVVVSSDLSHFLPYDEARTMDAATALAVEGLSPANIMDDQACGAYPLRGFLKAAKIRGLKAKRLALASSGDAAGPKDEVVGYGAWAFEA